MNINLEFQSLVELDAFVAHYAKNKTATITTDTPKDPPAPKVEPTKQATPKAETPSPKEPKAPAAPKVDPKQPPEGELNYANDIAPRVLKLAEAKGRDAAVAMLAKFGVTKAPQLEVGQYAEFVEAVDAKLTEE